MRLTDEQVNGMIEQCANFSNSKVQQQMSACLTELLELRETVAKLPKTADGVPVVPGMNLCAPNVDFDFGVLAVVDDPDEPDLNCRDVRGVEFGMDAGDCYSTKEAALAAQEPQ